MFAQEYGPEGLLHRAVPAVARLTVVEYEATLRQYEREDNKDADEYEETLENLREEMLADEEMLEDWREEMLEGGELPSEDEWW